MEAPHPPLPPLTPAQQAAMDQFRARIHQLVLSGSLSGESLRRMVQAMREHPEFSREILEVVTQELREMQEQAPWTHLFRLDDGRRVRWAAGLPAIRHLMPTRSGAMPPATATPLPGSAR